MKKMLIVFLFVLILLNGCAQTDPEPSTTPPTAEPTQTTEAPTTEPTVPTTEPTTVPTQPPTESTEPTIEPIAAVVFGYPYIESFHDVYVYPYTQEDIDSALSFLREIEESAKAKEEVLEYEIHWLTFDPIRMYCLTASYDPYVERYTYDSIDAHYQNTMFVTGRRTVHYDGTLTPAMSADNEEHTWVLCRESPDAPWEIYSGLHNPRYLTDDYYILRPDEIAALNLTDERILAAYFVSPNAYLYGDVPVPYEQDTYILYVVDEETNTVVCQEYPAE